MKNLILIGIALIIIIAGAYFLTKSSSLFIDTPDEKSVPSEVVTVTTTPATRQEESDVISEPEVNEKETVIGTSVENRVITAYHYGTGDTEVLFVGGIHGGYSWNTTLVAYELMDYLEDNPNVIPENVMVTVIPVLNPDGLARVVDTEDRFVSSDVSTLASALTSGRFNGNTVDLNRNFDCDWQSSGMWQSKTVSGGNRVFSEPESQALKGYVEARDIEGAVVWYSAGGGVFASNCHDDILPETLVLTNTYAKASGYKAYESFDFYEITGDMVNWLAKNDIPAISVLLTTHTDVEWDKNKAGIEALLKHYAK